jgi:BlaI family penicillinase repressor
METKTSPRPTNAELRILQVLWKLGPVTVRRVYEELGGTGGYTTVLKLMQIMVEKGLVSRNETERTHIYEAAIPENRAKKNLISDLIKKAFHGSAKELIVQALSTKRTSRAELAEIRKLIDEMEKRKS